MGRPPRVVLREGRLEGDLGKFDLTFILTREARKLVLRLAVSNQDGAKKTLPSAILSLDVGPTAKCTVHTGGIERIAPADCYQWEMQPNGVQDSGAFFELYSWGVGFLVGVGTGEEALSPRPAARLLRELCTYAETSALGLCEPRILGIARQFHEVSRFDVYGLVLRGGERMAQMAQSCPGVLCLIRALLVDGRSRSVEMLVDSIRQGEALTTVIEQAWSGCIPIADRRAECSRVEPRFQRQFIRRIPAALRIPAASLTVRRGIEASDIPRGLPERLRWYRVIVPVLASTALQAARAEHAVVVAGFFSRHADHVYQYAEDAAKSEEAATREIIDYALRSGERLPSRRSEADRVLAAVAAWHALTWTRTELPASTSLATCRIDNPTKPLLVSPIKTVGELSKEGKEMHHCIASYAGDAARGDLFVFRAKHEEERLTIALGERNNHLHVVEVAGKRNEVASGPAMSAIRTWVDAHAGAADSLDS